MFASRGGGASFVVASRRRHCAPWLRETDLPLLLPREKIRLFGHRMSTDAHTNSASEPSYSRAIFRRPSATNVAKALLLGSLGLLSSSSLARAARASSLPDCGTNTCLPHVIGGWHDIGGIGTKTAPPSGRLWNTGPSDASFSNIV
ncbi:hypothetical protein HPB47_025598 [Ixodes persulcatus]|uniref:Uncharacterized protein n=1 Tax=Ixodes persulcatus TaxID=34615 RepID=A0AC60Q188_IXOPE|nr:hypothetical protein HPB47_025598 [Ixodes persulcatus]